MLPFFIIPAPLNRTLEKGEPLHFEVLTDDKCKAIQDSKERLVSPPILTLLKKEGHYKSDTDMCDRQVGSTLLQDHGNQEFLKMTVGCWSRALTKQERHYTNTVYKCLAIVCAVLL